MIKRKAKIYLLLLMATLFALPGEIFAFRYDVFEYNILDEDARTCEVTKYLGEQWGGDIIIPPTVQYDGNDYQVIAIGDNAFDHSTIITSVTFPESLTTIGYQSFRGCINLTSVTFPDSLVKIDWDAFWGCSGLTSIVLPKSLPWIGVGTFYGCSALTSVVFPESLTLIADYAFGLCSSLTSMEFPESLTTIGPAAFHGCSALTSVIFPESLTSIDSGAFQSCTGLTSVNLPKSLTTIGERVFHECTSLTSIEYGAEQPVEASSDCFDDQVYQSTMLTVPNATLADIAAVTPWNLFKNVVAKDGTLPADPQVGDEFEYEDLWYRVIDVENSSCEVIADPSGVKYSGDVVVPATVSYNGSEYQLVQIGNEGFYMCQDLRSIVLPPSLKSIKNGAFSDCTALISVELPSSVTGIGIYAFGNCSSLTSIDLPPSLTAIEVGTFLGCSNLESIKFPASLTFIGKGAFTGCTGLTNIKYSAENPIEANSDCFDDQAYQSATLTMPNATLADIAAVTPWNLFKNVVAKDGTLPAEDPQVGNEFEYEGIRYTILDTEAMTCETRAGGEYESGNEVSGDISIPEKVSLNDKEYTVIGIGIRSFIGCTGMTSLRLPGSLTEIGLGAFANTGLQSVDFSACAALNMIGDFAFQESQLQSVDLTHCVVLDSINQYAFSKCANLRSVGLPESIKSIERSAFWHCTSLNEITLPESIEELLEAAFWESGLESIDLSGNNNLKIIGEFTFADCLSLKSIKLPSTLETIGYKGFASPVIESVEYSASEPVSASDGCFDETVYDSATLTMPNATLADIAAVAPWNLFKNVVAKDGTLPAEDPQYPVTFDHADPADGATVESIGKIATYWNVGDRVLVVSYNAEAYLRDPNTGVTVAIAHGEYDWDDYSLFYIEISPAISAPGSYELVIPEGFLVDMDDLGVSEAVTLHYTIENTNPEPQLITFDRADPADGSTVNSLSTVKTYWNVGDLVMVGEYSNRPYLLDAISGEKVTDATIDRYLDDSLFYVNLDSAVSTPGFYDLVIPEGAITDDNGTVNEAVTLHYTIETLAPQVGDRFEYRGVWYAITKLFLPECEVIANPDSLYTGDVTIVDFAMNGEQSYLVTRIADEAFLDCSAVTSVRLPLPLEYIGNSSFGMCTSLAEINLSSSLVRIEENAFAGCTGLTTLKIPDAVTYLGPASFGGCTGLKSIEIPASILMMEGAFGGCPNIESVYYPAEKPVESSESDFDEQVYEVATLTMPNATLEDIQSTMPWIFFRNVVAKDGVLPPVEPETVTFSHADPADGSNVSAFYEIRTYWNTDGRTLYGNESEYYFARLTYETGETLSWSPLLRAGEDGSLFVMDFSGDYAPGQYMVYIPEGALVDENGAGVSEAVTLHYTLEPPVFVPSVGDEFEYEGLWYTVTDNVMMTCETRGGSEETPGNNVEGDVIVSDTVYYASFELTVTGVGDYGFSGSSEMLSITLPATVESVGAQAFADCDRLTSLVWRASRPLDAEVIAAIGNPNLLVYVEKAGYAPSGMTRNVVLLETASGDAECGSLVLEPARAFRAALPFTALHSTMTKEFTQKTPIDGCAGWETIVLPFDATSVRVADARGELTPFRLVTDILHQYPYWLYEADNAGGWMEADTIKAGVPYIISMPNNDEYEIRYNIEGPVTFSNDRPVRITPGTTAPYAVTWPTGREFRSLWLPLAADEVAGAMGLNVGMNDITDDDGQTLDPGSAFCAGVEPQPLEAYVTRRGAERAMRITRNQSGVLMTPDDTLRVESEGCGVTIYSGTDRHVDLFSADGVRVAACEVKAGEPCRVDGLEKGIYIVAGRKVVIKN